MSINYNISLTGTCNGGIGTVLITPTSGNPPYTFQYQEGLGTDYSVTQSTRTGLFPNNYSVLINDSTAPPNNQTEVVNFVISSGAGVSITDISGSTCGQNNGYASVIANSATGIYTFQ